MFRTNEEGYLITPEQLKCGTYRIEEVEAPENYVQVGFENALLKDGKEVPLNEVADGGTYQEAKKAPITITVDSDTVHQVEEETGKFIVVIEQYNDEAVGSLTIHKKGEKLSGASKVEEKFLTKMKNGVAGFVNQVSSFFTGEEVMEKRKVMNLTMKREIWKVQNLPFMQRKPFIPRTDRKTKQETAL